MTSDATTFVESKRRPRAVRRAGPRPDSWYLTEKVKKEVGAMADRRLKIWYDREGDYVEVMFEDKAGYFRETDNDQVMKKVDDQGRVIGFSILKVSGAQSVPLEVTLSP